MSASQTIGAQAPAAASPDDPSAPGAPAPSVRGRLYALAMLLLLINAAADKAIAAVAASGPLGALLDGLGSSWAFWVAAAVTVGLAWRETADPAEADPGEAAALRPRDLALAAGAALVAMVPLSLAAGFACTGLAAAVLLDRTAGRYLKAAALVLLAISVQLVWTRLLMMFFVQPLATIDAHLVSVLIQRPVHGHAVQFADGSRMLSILGACTSVQNASIALMLYVAIVRAFRPVHRRSELAGLAGVFLSVVALNLVRLALMAQDIHMFHLVHDPAGASVVNAIITLTGLAWAAGSVRHELFR